MLKSKIYNIFNEQFNNIKPPIPKNMLVEVSNCCNSNCIFCSNNKMTRKRGEIDFNFLCKLLDEAYSLGVREVGFYTTGEPLLYGKLSESIKYSKKLGFEYIYITTNGILADENIIKKLIQNGLNSIKFSINAISREDYKFIHGVDKFDVVMENLKKINDLKRKYKLNLKIFISYIATKYTEYDTELIKRFFDNLCNEVIIVNVRNQSGLMPLETGILQCIDESSKVQADRHLPCHYLFNVINVSYEGYLTGCCTDFQNYLAYADLNKTSILEGWHNEIVTNLRKQHIDGALKNNLCYNCITHSKNIPLPLCDEYATKFNRNLFCNLKKFNSRIKERKDNMELVDLLNNKKEKTGEVVERNSVPENRYRLSIHVWIMNNNDELLIQQRSSNRKMFPNKWTNTGGANVSGESSIETVYRELKEELNVVPSKENLEFIASYKREKDYVDVWVLKQNLELNNLVLQKEEVQGVKWVSIKEWEKMVKDGDGIKSSTDYFLKYYYGEY